MNTITKKARKSATVLLCGMVALTGVSVYAMDNNGDQKDGLRDILENMEFRLGLFGCRQFSYRSAGGFTHRYSNVQQKPCDDLAHAMEYINDYTDKEVAEYGKKAFHASSLYLNAANIGGIKGTDRENEICELVLRKSLRDAEVDASIAGCGDIVISEPFDDKKRYAELEYKNVIANLEKQQKEQSSSEKK